MKKQLLVASALFLSVAAFAATQDTAADHEQKDKVAEHTDQSSVKVEEQSTDQPVPNRHPVFYSSEKTSMLSEPGYMRK